MNAVVRQPTPSTSQPSRNTVRPLPPAPSEKSENARDRRRTNHALTAAMLAWLKPVL